MKEVSLGNMFNGKKCGDSLEETYEGDQNTKNLLIGYN